jgi:hypothetical protein
MGSLCFDVTKRERPPEGDLINPFKRHIAYARSEYSMDSVFTTIISSWATNGGTMTLTPLSKIAGLNELAAV